MTPAEAVAFLQSLPASTIKLGLERVEAALADLGHPERALPAVHVAGTNGKGSTCAFVARALQAAGLRVGLYTSPHLVRFNERIQVDGAPIDDAALGARTLEVLERYARRDERPFPLTFFELGTLVALWHFAREKVDVAVLETGLGGRLDATNCCRPLVTAITPISFDHVEWLGHTLGAIAKEKAGILKPGVPVICAAQPPEALQVIESTAAALGAPLWLQGRDFELQALRRGGDSPILHFSSRRRWGEVLVPALSLRGPHQLQNAAVALACLEALEERGVRVTPDHACEGLRSAHWPGRLEEIQLQDQGPLLVLDGAHNPAGAEALAQALGALYPGRRVHAVFGVLADKDLERMGRALFPHLASLHLCPLPSPRSLAPEAYAARARAWALEAPPPASPPPVSPDVAAYPDAGATLQGAIAAALAGAPGGGVTRDLVLVTGSLVLVGQVKALLGRP